MKRPATLAPGPLARLEITDEHRARQPACQPRRRL